MLDDIQEMINQENNEKSFDQFTENDDSQKEIEINKKKINKYVKKKSLQNLVTMNGLSMYESEGMSTHFLDKSL